MEVTNNLDKSIFTVMWRRKPAWKRLKNMRSIQRDFTMKRNKQIRHLAETDTFKNGQKQLARVFVLLGPECESQANRWYAPYATSGTLGLQSIWWEAGLLV